MFFELYEEGNPFNVFIRHQHTCACFGKKQKEKNTFFVYKKVQVKALIYKVMQFDVCSGTWQRVVFLFFF